MPSRGKGVSRLRDALPLPLPDRPAGASWAAVQRPRQRGRQRHLRVAGELAGGLWLRLVVLAINFEHCGRLSRDHWRHSAVPSAAQRAALERLRAITYKFAVGCMARVNFPDWAVEVRTKVVSYNGDEGARALPLVLAELRPGFPTADVAASVDALALAPLLCENGWRIQRGSSSLKKSGLPSLLGPQ